MLWSLRHYFTFTHNARYFPLISPESLSTLLSAMRGWPTWTPSTIFLAFQLTVGFCQWGAPATHWKDGGEWGQDIYCPVFSLARSSQLAMFLNYYFQGNISFWILVTAPSPPFATEVITALYFFTNSIFWVSPSPYPHICKWSLANNNFQFIQTDVPSVSGWDLDCSSHLSYCSPVTIHFDVHLYLSLLIIFYLLL